MRKNIRKLALILAALVLGSFLWSQPGWDWIPETNVDDFSGEKIVKLQKGGMISGETKYTGGSIHIGFVNPGGHVSFFVFFPQKLKHDGVIRYKIDTNEIETEFWQRTTSGNAFYCTGTQSLRFIKSLLSGSVLMLRVITASENGMTMSVKLDGLGPLISKHWSLTNVDSKK